MSNNTSNTPNGVGDNKKELKVKRDIPEEEINRDIENWAEEKDEKGNIIPQTDGKTIAIVFGNPYFQDNIVTKDQKNEDTSGNNGNAAVTTVMPNQGKKTLEEVKDGLYIQTKSPEQSKDVKKKDSDKNKDEDVSRD